MDPFGDALYFVVGAIGSCALGIVPLWLAVLIVARYAGPVVLTPLVLLTGRRPELVYTVWGRRNTLLTGIVLFALYWVRLFAGPVDIVALIIALPTLVPTALLHFVALFRRVAAAPRAR
jgi:phosphatidylglycerophosphate synthase